MSDSYTAYKQDKPTLVTKQSFISGVIQAIPDCKLSEDTCRHFDYQLGEYKGKLCHIANYKDSKSQTVGQKVRILPKDFLFVGDSSKIELYGQSLLEPKAEWDIVITEGEKDCLSVYQAFGGAIAVVSLPFGAGNARQCIEKQINWLLKWKSIILAFDNDGAGHDAVNEVVKISALPHDKVKIATWPTKDAHELLMDDNLYSIKKSIWNASTYRPAWSVTSDELELSKVLVGSPPIMQFPYAKLNNMVRGVKPGRLYIFAAGSGMGKTTLVHEFVYDWLMTTEKRIGHMFYEENMIETAQTYIAMDNNIPDYKLSEDPTILTKAQSEASYKRLFAAGRICFDNHFGSLTTELLIEKFRYLITAQHCDVIILDHISIVVSGQAASAAGERKDIDMLMTALKKLSLETGVPFLLVCHLKRHQEASYNNGATVELSDLRGSGSLEQLSDYVIALEGDQFGSGNDNKRKIKVLKCRKGGFVGYADTLLYNKDTGRFLAIDDVTTLL